MTDKEREFIIEKREKFSKDAEKDLIKGTKISAIILISTILIGLPIAKYDFMDRGTILNCVYQSLLLNGTIVPFAVGLNFFVEKKLKSKGLNELLEDIKAGDNSVNTTEIVSEYAQEQGGKSR